MTYGQIAVTIVYDRLKGGYYPSGCLLDRISALLKAAGACAAAAEEWRPPGDHAPLVQADSRIEIAGGYAPLRPGKPYRMRPQMRMRSSVTGTGAPCAVFAAAGDFCCGTLVFMGVMRFLWARRSVSISSASRAELSLRGFC